MEIHYVEGDVIVPQFGDGPRMLAHVVNNRGGFGAGVALGVAQTYPQVHDGYKEWFRSQQDFRLGDVQFVDITDQLCVANMLCQDGYKSNLNPVPFQYLYFEQCFKTVLEMSIKNGYEIHMPQVGTGPG